MKALTYLQYDSLELNEYAKYSEYVFDNANPTDNKRRAFYSKPFNPEDIPELFEGWEYIRNENVGDENIQQYGQNDATFYFADKSDLFGIQIFKPYYFREYVNKTPQTLNDFITNCQQAGIGLVFKKGAGKV